MSIVTKMSDCMTNTDSEIAANFYNQPHRGTEEYFGLQGEVDIINSTIGKALGVNQGGYTTGPKELIDLLRHLSKSFRYTKTLSPSAAAAGCVVIH